MTYITQAEKQKKRRTMSRQFAIKKLGGETPKCAICGCPHWEVLHIGHMKHRGGRFHRRELGKDSRDIVQWVIKTSIEKVKERVQLECPYCNNWHNKFKEYPPIDKQPKWGNSWGSWGLNLGSR